MLLALDVGDARIGVARCDPDRLLASPVETVAAGAQANRRIAELVGEHGPVELLVGMPRSLSGNRGPAAGRIVAFAEVLAADLAAVEVSVPIRFIDERLTTVTAEQQLRQVGRKGAKRREVVDQAAAVVILQSALDHWRHQGRLPGELLTDVLGETQENPS